MSVEVSVTPAVPFEVEEVVDDNRPVVRININEYDIAVALTMLPERSNRRRFREGLALIVSSREVVWESS